MKYYGKEPKLYKPKTCKTYCFRMPVSVDARRQQVNTWKVNEREARKAMKEIIEQTYTHANDQVYEDAYLDKAVETYLTAKRGLSRKSFVKYRTVILDFMAFTVREMASMPRLDDIRKNLIEKYLTDLLDAGQSAKTYNDKRNILTNFFIYAVDSGWIKANPVHNIPHLSEPDSHYVPPTREDVDRILKSLRESRDRREKNRCYYEIMSVIYYAGLRISEVTHLFRDDIDFRTHTIHVRNKMIGERQYNTKTRRNWRAPMNSTLESILRDWLGRTRGRRSELLFPNSKSNPIKNDMVAMKVKKVMSDLGFPPEKLKKPLHGGRHAFASYAMESGVPEQVVQKALGHKSNIMTKHYTYLSPEHMKEQFDKLSYESGEK